LRPAPIARAAFAWSTLGLQWIQMMSASHQAIAHRTGRSNTPSQWFEMGGEKVAAALEASQAMTRHALAVPPSTLPAMWAAWARMLASGMTPYRVRAVRNARSARRR
jgi:hypothetical protein